MEKRPKIIAVEMHKGGVGKTTTSLNLAAGLSSFIKKRVLLIDLDNQMSLTSWLTPLDKETEESNASNDSLNYPSIYDYMIDEAATKGKKIPFSPVHINENLDFIPADIQLAVIDMKLSNVMEREKILKKFLKRTASEYDIVVLDCPPALNILTYNACICADHIIAPINLDKLSLRGLDMLVEDTIASLQQTELCPNINLSGIVINKFDLRSNLAKKIHQTLLDKYGDKVMDTKLRNTVTHQESVSESCDIFNYVTKFPSRNAAGANDCFALTKEIYDKLKL